MACLEVVQRVFFITMYYVLGKYIIYIYFANEMNGTKTINKAFKFRIYPNSEQRTVLAQHFRHCRFVFNHFLAERIAFYEANKNNRTKKGLNYSDNSASLTKLKKEQNTIWLKDINSQSLQASLKHLDEAYKKFFKGGGFPKFKSKASRQSFKVPQRFGFFSETKPVKALQGTKIKDSKHSWLKIPGMPKDSSLLKTKEHRKLPENAKILNITISKTPTGKYFASLSCELKIRSKALPKVARDKIKAIGIDLGIKDLVINSEGARTKNPKHLKCALKKLKYTQRQVSKKKKGSMSRNKARLRLARVHEKVTNTRKDTLHKISNQLIEKSTVVCMESLKVKNMVKNHKLAQAITDASWGELVRQINYKADHHRRVSVQIDTFFPSSKTCSCCGHKLDKLPLSVRKWKCPSCKSVHDRDVNAAINIRNEGLRILKIPLSMVV